MGADQGRRDFLKLAGMGTVGLVGLTAINRTGLSGLDTAEASQGHESHGAGHAAVPSTFGDFDPHAFLSAFDYGAVSKTASGRTVRAYHIVAEDKEIEIARGVKFPAWTFNGQVPGPTIRCTEGDLLRVHFENRGSHPHSIHFHGFHPPEMDGMVPVPPGRSFLYEFDADPFGLHLYHCHVMPLKRHIHKGLYGAFIIDPPGGRPPAREMVMVMNAFDLDQDAANEFYAVNTAAFAYEAQPIQVRVGELIRIYLVNVTEFDLVNSFHLHAGMFKYYPTGTTDQYVYTDTVMQCQGERGILEFTLKHPGRYMFHAHQSEFAELGWLGLFEAL
jgi:manganese oxidase